MQPLKVVRLRAGSLRAIAWRRGPDGAASCGRNGVDPILALGADNGQRIQLYNLTRDHAAFGSGELKSDVRSFYFGGVQVGAVAVALDRR